LASSRWRWSASRRSRIFGTGFAGKAVSRRLAGVVGSEAVDLERTRVLAAGVMHLHYRVRR
jgi:hypothetical protein